MINDPKRRIADVVLDELAREFREHIEKQEEEQREIVARLASALPSATRPPRFAP